MVQAATCARQVPLSSGSYVQSLHLALMASRNEGMRNPTGMQGARQGTVGAWVRLRESAGGTDWPSRSKREMDGKVPQRVEWAETREGG